MLASTYDGSVIMMKGVGDLVYKSEVMMMDEALEDSLVLAEEEYDEERSIPLVDCCGPHFFPLNAIYLSCTPNHNAKLLSPTHSGAAHTISIDVTTIQLTDEGWRRFRKARRPHYSSTSHARYSEAATKSGLNRLVSLLTTEWVSIIDFVSNPNNILTTFPPTDNACSRTASLGTNSFVHPFDIDHPGYWMGFVGIIQ